MYAEKTRNCNRIKVLSKELLRVLGSFWSEAGASQRCPLPLSTAGRDGAGTGAGRGRGHWQTPSSGTEAGTAGETEPR